MCSAKYSHISLRKKKWSSVKQVEEQEKKEKKKKDLAFFSLWVKTPTVSSLSTQTWSISVPLHWVEYSSKIHTLQFVHFRQVKKKGGGGGHLNISNCFTGNCYQLPFWPTYDLHAPAYCLCVIVGTLDAFGAQMSQLGTDICTVMGTSWCLMPF